MGRDASWRNTTHDWATTVDLQHLATIRGRPSVYAPGGVKHLVSEVLAYAAEEAQALGRPGTVRVMRHADGSVSVADDGRGTDTRLDADGQPIKKPVMATRDLRFFDDPGAASLPDGHLRRGISVVAALSQCLVHTNRRRTGSWTQRYEHGIPVTDLTAVRDDGTTGTTVRFQPDLALVPGSGVDLAGWEGATSAWPDLHIEVVLARVA